MSSAAARLSAERPVWKAATRSGEACLSGVLPPAPVSVLAIAPHLLGKLERAGIDLASRPPRELDRVRDRILDAVVVELLAQEIVQGLGGDDLRVGRRRANHQHELAPCLKRI